jgi:hypothetical protein
VGQRIVDLQEIRLLPLKDGRDRRKGVGIGGGNADLAAMALGLARLQQGEILARFAHIPELQEITGAAPRFGPRRSREAGACQRGRRRLQSTLGEWRRDRLV